MPYLRNQPDSNFTTTTVDTFNGDNSTVAFTLSRSAQTNDLEVFVENVQQQPTTAYSVAGTTITFTSAPPTGTGNIYVIHRGAAITSPTPNENSITLDMLTTTGTPSSSTYLRGDNSWAALSTTFEGLTDTTVSTSDPTLTSNPSATGHIWVNKISGEMYVCTDATTNANVWTNVGEGIGSISPPYSIEYVLVAGGGGGGFDDGGGGGAGGYRTSHASDASGRASSTETPFTATPGTHVYTIVVGGGGNGGPSEGNAATNGDDSSIAVSGGSTITSTGGGFGRGSGGSSTGNGGCGGGGRASLGTGGSGTAGQGFGGGSGGTNSGGGGGGTGEEGFDGDNSPVVYGYGGDGTVSTILTTANATSNSVGHVVGSDLYFGGGGGNGSNSLGQVAGGSGGGGDGRDNDQTGLPGTDFTGGGGGSGVVILRMPTSGYSGTYTGSNVTAVTEGSDTVLIFKSSGTYTA